MSSRRRLRTWQWKPMKSAAEPGRLCANCSKTIDLASRLTRLITKRDLRRIVPYTPRHILRLEKSASSPAWFNWAPTAWHGWSGRSTLGSQLGLQSGIAASAERSNDLHRTLRLHVGHSLAEQGHSTAFLKRCNWGHEF